MSKIRNILLLVIIFCIIGTVNVYAAQTQLLLQGDDTANPNETKSIEVKLQAEEDMRRSTI